jgi:hypothetical protein
LIYAATGNQPAATESLGDAGRPASGATLPMSFCSNSMSLPIIAILDLSSATFAHVLFELFDHLLKMIIGKLDPLLHLANRRDGRVA